MRSLRSALPLVLALVPATFTLTPAVAWSAPAQADADPLVIGHRGASGYRPEHTLAGYRLAAEQGADFIEPDLVITKDGVLVARHENEIGGTTNVADHPEFADRRTTKVIDGASFTGWFTEDFTLAELKTLRAKERIPELRPDNTAFDGQFEVPTLDEVLELRKTLSKELGRTIGVYPETKHPTYFRSIGQPLEEPLVESLTRAGLNREQAPVFVQSFETGNLRGLDDELRVPLVQLFGGRNSTIPGESRTYADLATPAGLREIATYADGVGPSKDYVVPRQPDGNLAEPTAFVGDAHEAGLLVHPYTFRRENTFLPLDLRSSAEPAGIGNLEDELRAFIDAGVDGFFTDNPDIGAAATRETIAVIGDTPYGAAQLEAFPEDVAAINADPSVGTVLHLGDIKSGSGQCTNEYFRTVRSAFDAFEDPLVFTPGDNEWTDCHRASNGGYLPVERLAALRRTFFPRPGRTLGRAETVRSQWFFPENVEFAREGVQFGAVHIVGSNDGRARWFGDRVDSAGSPMPETWFEGLIRKWEVSVRQSANLAWIDEVFREARRDEAAGVALALQADMWDSTASDRGGFRAYVQRIARNARSFDGPVLLLNGDSHAYTADRPLAAGDSYFGVTEPVPNLSRITVNGSTSCPHEYLRLRIDPASAEVFTHERVTLPASSRLCGA